MLRLLLKFEDVTVVEISVGFEDFRTLPVSTIGSSNFKRATFDDVVSVAMDGKDVVDFLDCERRKTKMTKRIHAKKRK